MTLSFKIFLALILAVSFYAGWKGAEWDNKDDDAREERGVFDE